MSVGARERRARGVQRRYRWRSSGAEALLRLLGWALRCLAGRMALLLAAPFSEADAREARRRAWTARSFASLVEVLGRLKGAFVKAGQFAAHRHDLLPEEAVAPLALLRDRVAPLGLDEIRPVVEAELGAPLETLFDEFDAWPLGAASVAQVHRARLPGGEEVAVKVQYPWLESALPADLGLLRVLLRLAARLSGASGLDAGRVAAEFERGLREELDFRREAQAAAAIAANLTQEPQVVVPRVVASHSGRRVLTTGFHPAVPIGDREGLRRLGVSPRDVAAVVARAYAKQAFVDGLFHADPHPGNLFVLDEPGAAARPRVLFVDFGLSRHLDPGLRREMRSGAHALLKRDLESFLAGMKRLGMIAPHAEPGVRDALKQMFERLGRPGGALALAGWNVLGLKDEAVRLLRGTRGLQLPDDLLLFAKTLSYVFALGRDLDPQLDLMQPCLPYVLRFLGTRD